MLTFDAKINRFQEKGEKTGWTYIEIRPDQAEILNPGIKKSFRVKGFIDNIANKSLLDLWEMTVLFYPLTAKSERS